MCACLSTPQHASGGQKTTWKTSFLSTCKSWELNPVPHARAGAFEPTHHFCHYVPLPEGPEPRVTAAPADNREPNLPALLAKPTLARLPLHGCRLPPHCHCTHTLSPLQRRPRILFHSRPQPPPWVGRPQLGMSMCTAQTWSCKSGERVPWAGRLGQGGCKGKPKDLMASEGAWHRHHPHPAPHPSTDLSHPASSGSGQCGP